MYTELSYTLCCCVTCGCLRVREGGREERRGGGEREGETERGGVEMVENEREEWVRKKEKMTTSVSWNEV